MPQRRVVYVTSSEYKRAENSAVARVVCLRDGTRVGDLFRFDIRHVRIQETLEIQIAKMVETEAKSAYAQLRVPCVVEHAGLVFEEYLSSADEAQYPGGLTKPMWDALGDRFLDELNCRGRRAVARAVVGYCDGQSVRTFVGETHGMIATEPRGSRAFYWDTVFVPDHPDGTPGALTFAEIVDDASLGLDHKVVVLSQSTRAMVAFLEWLRASPAPHLWPASE